MSFDLALKDYKRKLTLVLDEILTKSPLCF